MKPKKDLPLDDPFGITGTNYRRSGGPVEDRILETNKATYEEDDSLNESLHESKIATADREAPADIDA